MSELTLSIATGADPVKAVAAAISGLPAVNPHVWRVSVAHDDGCPCTEDGKPMGYCTCEIVDLTARRVDTIEQAL